MPSQILLKLSAYFLKKKFQPLEVSKTPEFETAKKDPEVVLARKILESIDVNATNEEYENTNIEDRLDDVRTEGLLAKAHTWTGDNDFKEMLDFLIEKQINHSIRYASDMTQVSCGRFTINGISIVKEEIERLSKLYDEKHKETTTDFNKFNVI